MAKDESAKGEDQDENAAVKKAFNDAIKSGKDEDSIKMAMIAAGATFKNVTRLYNQYLVESGLAVSTEEKQETVDKVCQSVKKLNEEEGFNKAVEQISGALKGVDEKSAAASIRAWAKKNDVEVYKKPKGGSGRVGFTDKFYNFISNSKHTPEQVKAFIMGTDGNEETSANVKNHLSHYMKIYEVVEEAVKSRSK